MPPSKLACEFFVSVHSFRPDVICRSQANKEWLLQHAAEEEEDDTDYEALEAAAKAAAEAEAV